MFAPNVCSRCPGLQNFTFWGRIGLFRIFDSKMPEICVFKFPRFGKNIKNLVGNTKKLGTEKVKPWGKPRKYP